MMLTIGIWFCALAASACTLAVVLFMRQNRLIVTTLEAQLVGLGETHRLGIEVLNIDVERLRTRVAELEAK
jgi:hypothetical protein